MKWPCRVHRLGPLMLLAVMVLAASMLLPGRVEAAPRSGGSAEAVRSLLPADQRDNPVVSLTTKDFLFVVFRNAGPVVVWFVDPHSHGADAFEWELEELAESARADPKLRDSLFVRVLSSMDDDSYKVNGQLLSLFGIQSQDELPVLALLPPAENLQSPQDDMETRLNGLLAFDPMVPLHSLSQADIADWLRATLDAQSETSSSPASGASKNEDDQGPQMATTLTPPIAQYLDADQLDQVLSDMRLRMDIFVYFQDPESGWSESVDIAFEQAALTFQAEAMSWEEVEDLIAEEDESDPEEVRLLFVRHDTSADQQSAAAKALGINLPVPYPVFVYYSLASPTNKYVKVYHGDRQAAPIIEWLRQERSLPDWHGRAVEAAEVLQLKSVPQWFHVAYHPDSNVVVLFCDSDPNAGEADSCASSRRGFDDLARLWAEEPRVVFAYADKQIFDDTLFWAYEVSDMPHVRLFRASPGIKTVQPVIPGVPSVQYVSKILVSLCNVEPPSALQDFLASPPAQNVRDEL